jgi:hypothetical protein
MMDILDGNGEIEIKLNSQKIRFPYWEAFFI